MPAENHAFLRGRSRLVLAALWVGIVVVAFLPGGPARSSSVTFGDGDTSVTIEGEVASTQVDYACSTPSPTSDPNCNNIPLRFETTDDFTSIYVELETDPVQAPDLDVYLYDAAGTELGRSADVGSDERIVIRLDRPITTDAVLVVTPYLAREGTPFSLALRVKTSNAVPDPVVTPAT